MVGKLENQKIGSSKKGEPVLRPIRPKGNDGNYLAMVQCMKYL